VPVQVPADWEAFRRTLEPLLERPPEPRAETEAPLPRPSVP